ncbi:MAG TPA: hypothetical protein HA367_06150 [Candidatus Methanofastidiosum sp.]|nr:hypothetical protein [Methanofastidiosum sp.]
MELIIAIIIVGLLLVYTSFSWGLVLFKFWGWFVLPVFENLPVLTFYQAIGLMLVIGLFHSHYITPKEYDMKNEMVSRLLHPWVALFVGWFINALIF